MNGNNHLVEDSVGRNNDTSPHPHFKTQAFLQLLLLWSVSMGVVIMVANVEVQNPQPVLYLCCFTNSAAAEWFCVDNTSTQSSFKRVFFFFRTWTRLED